MGDAQQHSSSVLSVFFVVAVVEKGSSVDGVLTGTERHERHGW